MKALLFACVLVFTASVAAVAGNGEKITDRDLIERSGVWFQKSAQRPFTGRTDGLRQYSYLGGKRHGRGLLFYESGQLKAEMRYENGKLNGPYVMYFENGRPMMRGTMKNDTREGRWEVFYFNGDKSLHSSGIYRNGKWVAP
jgi:antitoxin component YwqK of YwqJK toxin-antitoxin module